MPQPTPKRAGRQAKPGSRFPTEVLAQNLRGYRTIRGLSQEQLAERMAALGHGWSPGIVGTVERGERHLTVDELLGAALVLAVAPGHLLSPYGVDGHNRSSLDVGLAEPISFGPAFAWVDQTLTAELVWSEGPDGIYWRANQRRAVSEDAADGLAETFNEAAARQTKPNPRRKK